MRITVDQQLARLREATATGELADLCARFGIEIVTLFGSAARPEPGIEPGDVDIAIGFGYHVERDLIGAVNALADLVPGDHLDVMDLNRAGPVAAKAAMFESEILFETQSSVSAERQIKAFMEYEDTRWLRDLQLEVLRG